MRHFHSKYAWADILYQLAVIPFLTLLLLLLGSQITRLQHPLPSKQPADLLYPNLY